MVSVFGLDTNVTVEDDEVALEVIGVLKYLDSEGNVEFAVYRSDNLTAPESYGMMKMAEIALRDELDGIMYLAMDAGWDEDDDD